MNNLSVPRSVRRNGWRARWWRWVRWPFRRLGCRVFGHAEREVYGHVRDGGVVRQTECARCFKRLGPYVPVRSARA